MALYLMTYIPIFLSREATRVRICIAMNPAELQDALDHWPPYQQAQPSKWTLHHPYKLVRHGITRAMVWYSERCVAAHTSRRVVYLRFLQLAAEFLFLPWLLTPVFLLLMWFFGLGFMIFKVHTTNLTTSWSFGQLLPVFLVLLPFFTLVGTIVGMYLQLIFWLQKTHTLLDAGSLQTQYSTTQPPGHSGSRSINLSLIDHGRPGRSSSDHAISGPLLPPHHQNQSYWNNVSCRAPAAVRSLRSPE